MVGFVKMLAKHKFCVALNKEKGKSIQPHGTSSL